MVIWLRDQMATQDGWGHAQGRQVHDKLRAIVDAAPTEQIFAISLAGVERTDASFPRESVIELARRYRKERGFCLVDVNNTDLLDNWDAAALRREQPLTLWKGMDGSIIGPQPSEGLREMLSYVLSVPATLASEAATALDLKLPNASNKLKQLWDDGYILRRERVAPSGGVEFEYVRIG